MLQTKEVKVRYYYNTNKQERIRVEPVEFITAKSAGKKFDLKKLVEKILKKNPNSAIVLDDFLSRQYNSLAQSLGFVSYMNFPTQLTYNINNNNTQILM